MAMIDETDTYVVSDVTYTVSLISTDATVGETGPYQTWEASRVIHGQKVIVGTWTTDNTGTLELAAEELLGVTPE